MHKVLFVCSQNKLRSPTAEAVFLDHPEMEVASAGLNRGADIMLSTELVEWAEVIFVMERKHQNKLSQQFKNQLKDKRVICLGIPDEFEYMDPQLIQILKSKVGRHLRLAESETF